MATVVRKAGKCSLYFGQPCAQNSILEKDGDTAERELAVSHHHLSRENHSLVSFPQLEAAGTSFPPPPAAFFFFFFTALSSEGRDDDAFREV